MARLHRHLLGCFQAWGEAHRRLVSTDEQLHVCSSVQEEGLRNGQEVLVCPGPLPTSVLACIVFGSLQSGGLDGLWCLRGLRYLRFCSKGGLECQTHSMPLHTVP